MPAPSPTDLLTQALAHHRAGRIDLAEAAYRDLLKQDPHNASALHHLGVIARQKGQLPEAIDLMRRSVELDPHSLPYRLNLASTFRAHGLLDQAKSTLIELLSHQPDDPIARDELGLVFDKLGQYEQAVEQYRLALNLFHSPHADPRQISRTCVNLGSALARLGRYDESLAAADEAVKHRPDYPLAHINRSHALFRLGRLPEAWLEYEWRWKRDDFTQKWPPFPQPTWDGSALQGKRLLLWHEQGFGDTVHFCRFAPLAARTGGGASFRNVPARTFPPARIPLARHPRHRRRPIAPALRRAPPAHEPPPHLRHLAANHSLPPRLPPGRPY